MFADNSVNAESSAARSRLNVSLSTVYQWPFHCTLKIETNADGQKRRTTPKRVITTHTEVKNENDALGGEEVTLTPGQTFYEGPTDVHVVGRNASSTQPAKFLVFLVKDKGAPVLVPVQ